MISPTLLKRLSENADELVCRFSNGKVELLTELGKRILPNGRWGHAPGHEADHPTVYLTFDDGPHPDTTPALLELLAQHDMKATFFLIGYRCKRYPHLVKLIHEQGHTLGNHTYHHLLLPLLPTGRLKAEISGTNRLIEEITGVTPTVFRPPFGIMDERAARIIEEEGMTTVYWGSAPEDWLVPGSHRVIRRVMWKIADGTLIVLHEGSHLGEQTIAAASEIISRTKSLGYRFSKVNVRA
jgi:peptidoglycan/xylan/chitin deacetylase (PgdA/CDA1 family)